MLACAAVQAAAPLPRAESALPVIQPIAADVDTRPFRVTDPHYIAMALQALTDDGDLVCLYPSSRRRARRAASPRCDHRLASS